VRSVGTRAELDDRITTRGSGGGPDCPKDRVDAEGDGSLELRVEPPTRPGWQASEQTSPFSGRGESRAGIPITGSDRSVAFALVDDGQQRLAGEVAAEIFADEVVVAGPESLCEGGGVGRDEEMIEIPERGVRG
jgi:hypothetical protein